MDETRSSAKAIEMALRRIIPSLVAMTMVEYGRRDMNATV
jgi:ribosome biogenesis protein Tsr3